MDKQNQMTPVIKATDLTADIKTEMNAHVYTNATIRAYSIDDDVIGMVESNTPPSNSRLFCGESGAGADENYKLINLTVPNSSQACGTLGARVKYVHGGIYFHLYSEYKKEVCCTRTILIHRTPVGGKVKCGYSWGPTYNWDNYTESSVSCNKNWQEHYYQNIQPLNAYWVRIVFMAKDASNISNPDNPSIDVEIRKNM